jgi:uncharacterized protein
VPSLAARIGVISDTHGLLREAALRALEGSELIVHAGDIGKPEILDALRELAPVVAVRGNVDTLAWAQALPLREVVEANGATLYIVHDLHDLDVNPAVAGFSVVISGHTHRATHFEREGVLYLNPGSAGPRRFTLPVTVARLRAGARPWEIEFVPCGDSKAAL